MHQRGVSLSVARELRRSDSRVGHTFRVRRLHARDVLSLHLQRAIRVRRAAVEQLAVQARLVQRGHARDVGGHLVNFPRHRLILTETASLWALFASSFLAATVLPGGSELVLAGLLKLHPTSIWPALAVATVGNTLVVAAIATSKPDRTGTAVFSNWANGNLANLTEIVDNSSNAGNGGGLGIATGAKATAGAFGSTAVTLTDSAAKAMMSIAIKPRGSPPVMPPAGTMFVADSIMPGRPATLVARGIPGWSYTIERSTNLTDWSAVTNAANPMVLAGTNGMGFYRAVK